MKMIQKSFALTEKGARGMVVASIASFIVNVVMMVSMMSFFVFADDILADGVLNQGMFYAIALPLIVVVMYLILSFEYRATYNATYMEARDLRISIADTLKELPIGYFAKHDLSDLAQTMMQDVLDLEHALSHSLPRAFGSGAFLLLIFILMVVGNVKVGLLAIAPILISLLIFVVSKRAQKRCAQRFYDKTRSNTEIIQDAIEMQQEIQSFHLVRAKRREVHQALMEAERIHIRSEIGQGIPVSTAFAVVKLALGTTVLAVSGLLVQGTLSPLFAIGYLIAIVRLLQAVEAVGMDFAELFYIDARVKRIKELKNTEVQTGDMATMDDYGIEARDVSFSYGNRPVLDGVSFTAHQGEVTALVGPSGSGKTTMLRLIARLYDYQQGHLCVGGRELNQIDPKTLYAKISMVFQEVTLFNGTILENIRIGRKTATDEEVREAARKANCLGFIEALPDGFETMIGENGSKLSGGERQRLSIARAFLKNAPILLLDEISASLDVENEMEIQKSLNLLMKDKTVIIISHRMKSIEKVDKIIVFDQGKIVNQGTHDALMQESALYQTLIQKSTLAERYVY